MTQQSDECIEAIKAILAIAPMLPVEAKDAQAWTEAITSILINIGAETTTEKTGTIDYVHALRQPHEWGYRDPVDGSFIVDFMPFDAATELESLHKDAARLAWMLDGNGYFLEEEGFCGHSPVSDREKKEALKAIDEAMLKNNPAVAGQ